MKGVSAWVWKTGRVLLAAVLLVAVFKYTVKVSDSIRLRDNTEVSGTITTLNDKEVTIQAGREALTYPIADLALRKGEPWIEQGLISLLKRMSLWEYAAGLLLLGVAPVVGAIRWRMLLAGQGIHITARRSLDLTLIGLFFNNVMPGLTGGDVVKAYYAAKLTSDKKTHAVVTVFLDRVIGMVALGIVAGGAILIGLATSGAVRDSNYRDAAWFVLGFMVISVAGGIAFYSRRLRRVLGAATRGFPGYRRVREAAVVERAAKMIKRVDSALFLYRDQKMVLFNTTAISFIAHASAIMAIYFFGRALGVTQAGVLHYFVVVPVCFIISSIGITPNGWGVGEVIFRVLFGAGGVAGTAAVTMSVIYRLTQSLWTLPGGVLFMFERDRAAAAEAAREAEEGLVEGEDGGQGD
jgi:hypothetical protein